MNIKAKITVAAALAIAATTLGAAQATAAPERPSGSVVVGSAGGPLTFPGYDNDPVRFDFAAFGEPGKSSGRFHVNHVTKDGKLVADFEGKVDCVSRAGSLAVLTGVIERADIPGLPITVVGRRVGFSVQDEPRGHDRIGWSWAYGGIEHDVLPCTGPVPFFPTSTGGYVVR
ncbi:hypothetical protein [Amycolatopsis azurea]|uniref:Repetin n=1 Tax=Amycolatopsis azurea DSM 43854 TaxID=1238180 RepID=M2Q545_9PSEU|nr:hypothetical protein [Amycolatopsis azurea]EMD21886.1 hypothetical protein C791_0736 [Amycolatopsis azurea DSM 43854]OOC05429.1 hypothetical protein B0293_18550 [Amycolatopsis azurea DSM 43854]